MKSSILLKLLFLFSLPASAELLQIIHTNDLHSHFDSAADPQRGSFAAVKAKIDALKLEAQEQKIETLVLDAGDFSEGSRYYFANHALEPFTMIDQMGYDAVALGNHDWLMGLSHLEWILNQTKPSQAFLAANFHFRKRKFSTLSRYIQPHRSFKKAGFNIAVLGLTTPELFYNWVARPGRIYKPVPCTRSWLRKHKNQYDFVFALTHLGLSADKKLVKKTRGIDLVIGGHSHTLLNSPVYIKDKRKRTIPIVQAGKHGEYVGSLLIDLQKGKAPLVLKYELFPVFNKQKKDPNIEALAQQAQIKLENDYGKDYLRTVLAKTEVPLGTRAVGDWDNVVADAIKEATDTDIGVHFSLLNGKSIPPGSITRQDLMTLLPRQFDTRAKHGWTIWKTKVLGSTLKIIVNIIVNQGFAMTLSGVQYDVIKKPSGRWKSANVTVNGSPLKFTRFYSLAIPEGIGRGSIGITPLVRILFNKLRDTKISMWTAIEEKLVRDQTIQEQWQTTTQPPAAYSKRKRYIEP